MSTKLLNLDDFIPATKVIRLDGQDHAMRELTVAEFIAKTKQAKDTKADDSLTLEQQVEKTIEMIIEGFPSLTAERLGRLSLQQLTVILDFILKAPEQIEAEAKAQAGNA